MSTLKIWPFLLGLLLGVVASDALAQTPTQLPSPPGWRPGVGGGWTFAPPPSTPWVNGVVNGNISTVVGGRAVTVPYRVALGPNAATAAMTIIRTNPAVRLVPVVGQYVAIAGLIYDAVNNEWRLEGSKVYQHCEQNWPPEPASTPEAVCAFADQIDTTPGVSWFLVGVDNGLVGQTGMGCQRSDHDRPVHSVCRTGPVTRQPRVATPADFDNARTQTPPGPDVIDATGNHQDGPGLPSDLPQLLPDVNNWPETVIIPTGPPVPSPSGGYQQPGVPATPTPTATTPWGITYGPPVTVPTTQGGIADPSTTPQTSPNTITCGLPDTPACRINEQGTPSGSADGSTAAARAQSDAAATDILGRITNPERPASLGWSFTYGLFGIPAAACQPFQWGSRLGAIVVDVCSNELVLTVRAMLAWLLYAITLLYVWRRSNEAMAGAG